MSFGIYIQVPFCQTKCTYCNFHTGVVARDRYAPYAAAICREIELEGRGFNPAASVANMSGALAPEANPRTMDTIYFGGGTPSLLDPTDLAKVLDALRLSFQFASAFPSSQNEISCHPEAIHSEGPASSFSSSEVTLEADDPTRIVIPRKQRDRGTTAPPIEITLEADPETVTDIKAASWLAAGFNRISLGAQSFSDLELQSAGRMHRRLDIYAATEILRTAGFDNISMDLIAGLPHQTRESWENSIAELLGLRPEHISIYMLEIDEGSRLGKESLAGGTRYSAGRIPSDDAMAEFYDSACARLAAAGYDHYEISNWALPSRRSRHNLKYWRREPYLGFGAGAHSFDGTTRCANFHDPARYVACIEQGISPREQIEAVTSAQALEEEFFLGLRQLEGIDLSRIESAYAASERSRVADLRSRIAGLRSQGLVELVGSRLRLAPNRLTISNEVLVELLG
jgi:oxygen-independent coproporphyrinogen-3 oxidase